MRLDQGMRLLLVAAGVAAGVARQRRKRAWFAGRSVLITGGSRGLGLCLARNLAAQGAHLTLAARDPLELETARGMLSLCNLSVHTVVCDVADPIQAAHAVHESVQQHGGLDMVINNAGVIQMGPLQHMRLEDYTRAMDTHFYGALHICTAALEYLRESSMPRIVNITSLGGRVAFPHLLPYSASKFALVGYSQGLQSELAPQGIRVTTVVPGLLRTGSHLRALMKGDHAREFAWFALPDTAPGTSTDADRAARQILHAARTGQPYLSVSLGAALLSRLAALFPNTTARVLSQVARLLPAPVGPEGDENVEGADTRSPLQDSILTALGARAAARNNEI